MPDSPPPPVHTLSAAEARRVALAAQGFGRRRPDVATRAHLRRIADRLALHQIDSVNVLARAHYLPAFSRAGPYAAAELDRDAWGPVRGRRLFEYWAHEASLLPLDLHPLLRWRMAEADRGETGYGRLRPFAAERRAEAMALLARVEAGGPVAASDVEGAAGAGGWWGWSAPKQALEWLFWAGRLTTATRRPSFERVYDLPARVLPAAVLALPTPEPETARAALVERAARALGVATTGELGDYFRLSGPQARAAVARLAEDGVLVPVAVEGWGRPAWLHRDAPAARRIDARALLAPFDPLVWERGRTERLFGFRYRIEIYVPAERRVHGYYVLPFLHRDRLAARVDLKADRRARRLLVRRLHLEPGAAPDTRDALAAELALMAGWLGLEGVVMG